MGGVLSLVVGYYIMNRKQAVAIGIVCLLVVPGAASAVVRGSPDLSVFTPDNTVAPGQKTGLNIQIQNTGDVDVGSADPSLTSQVTTARGVTAELDTSGTPIKVETTKTAVGTIQNGQIQTANFVITVPEGTEEGVYETTLDVEYSYTQQIAERSRAYQNRETSDSYTIEIQVEDQARFKVINSSTDVLVGDQGTITLDVKNVGSRSAADATFNLRSSTPDIRFGQSAAASRFVGEWESGETKTIEFKTTASDEAEVNSYSLSGSVAFENTDGVPSRSNNLSIGVTPQQEQAFEISDVSSDLRVGQEGTVQGRITNLGPKTAQNAVVTINLNSATLSSQESEYAVGTLEPNESTEFEFSLDVSESADAGSRQLTHQVKYQNEDGEDRQSKSLNSLVRINESRDRFDVSIKNSEIAIGQSQVTTITVTNNGNEPLTNIDAKAYVNDPLTLDDDEAFVGSLAPGESAEIKVQTSVGGSALAKDYPLSVDFQYELPDGDTRISETYKVPISAIEDDSSSGLPLTAIGIVALLIVIIGGIILYRRRT